MTDRLHLLLLPSLIVALVASGCGDDASATQPDGALQADATTRPDGALQTDTSPGSDVELLAWPDTGPPKNLTGTACTPQAEGMCDANKTYHCESGQCTPCPLSYVDCDRKDDCECIGACDGNKCVKGGG